jgi:fumarate reductase subunit D
MSIATHRAARTRAAVAAEIAGACFVLVATLMAPWATYRLRGAASTHSLHADSLSPILILIAALAVSLGATEYFRPLRALAWTTTVVGGVTIVLTLLEAARRISHANSLTLTPGGSTHFAVAALLALLGGSLVTGGGAALLGAPSPVGSVPTTPPRE